MVCLGLGTTVDSAQLCVSVCECVSLVDGDSAAGQTDLIQLLFS